MIRRSSIAAGGWLLDRYLRKVAIPCRTAWYTPLNDTIVQTKREEVPAFIAELTKHEPVLFLFWNAHSLLILTTYLNHRDLRGSFRSLEAVADDSMGGQITQSLFTRVGLRLRLLRHADPAERLADLGALLTDRPNIAMAIDSHGPYRHVGTPIARLAKSLAATVVPVSATSARSIKIFRRIAMAVPLPGATIAVALAAPICCRTLSVSEIRARLAYSLIDVESRLESARDE